MSDSNRDVKMEIVHSFIREFNKKGHKATLDEVSANIHISKKTIYKYFSGKQDIYAYILASSSRFVAQAQEAIFADPSLATLDKFRKLLTIKTPFEDELDMNRLHELSEFEPEVYAATMSAYESQWVYFRALLAQGKQEGVFKADANEEFLVGLFTAGMEMLYRQNLLKKIGMTYYEAICQLAETIIFGIRA